MCGALLKLLAPRNHAVLIATATAATTTTITFIIGYASAASPLPSCPMSNAMEVINDKFDGIEAGSRIFGGVPNVYDINVCLKLDYDNLSNNNDYEHHYTHMRDILFGEFCDANANDGTCKAINATYAVYNTLQDMGCAPVFRNYLPAWEYPNQTTVACETGSFDVESKSFIEGKENGCNGFGLCNTLTTILTLSANQQRTGTCGPTAALMSLSKADPARALKLSTQLLWTGQTEFLETPPCSYIYDIMPGVQDLPKPDETLQDVCGMASPTTDCNTYYTLMKNAYALDYAFFVQNPGLEFMFTQAFGTSWFYNQTGGCTPEGFQMIDPSMDNSDTVEEFQGVTAAAMMFWCNTMIDRNTQECQLHVNNDLKSVPAMSDSAWQYWVFGNYGFWPLGSDGANLTSWLNGTSNYSLLSERVQNWILGVACSVEPGKPLTNEEFNYITDDLIDIYNDSFQGEIRSQPQISEEQLNQACEYTEAENGGAALVIQAEILDYRRNYTLAGIGNPVPPTPETCKTGTEPYCDGMISDVDYPKCNHYVMLLRCDIPNNNYTIWTWASEVSLPKEVLVRPDNSTTGGSICSIVTAGRKTNYAQPEPTPCVTAASNAAATLVSSPLAQFFVLLVFAVPLI